MSRLDNQIRALEGIVYGRVHQIREEARLAVQEEEKELRESAGYKRMREEADKLKKEIDQLFKSMNAFTTTYSAETKALLQRLEAAEKQAKTLMGEAKEELVFGGNLTGLVKEFRQKVEKL